MNEEELDMLDVLYREVEKDFRFGKRRERFQQTSLDQSFRDNEGEDYQELFED